MAAVIHVVDDDLSFRTAIGRLLRASGYEVEEYASAQQLLDRLPTGVRSGCILLDLRLPGLSGLELQKRLVELGSTFPIVFLTGHGDIPTSVQAVKTGAEDFLTKPVLKENLLDAIERAIARHQTTRRQRERTDALRALIATLTPREKQVFERVVRGKMNKQIAHELGISVRTIKAHRHKVMEKVGARSMVELVSIAERIK